MVETDRRKNAGEMIAGLALAGADISGAVGAPVRITSASLVHALSPLIAAQVPDHGGRRGLMSEPAAKFDRTRPVLPYPSTAQYTGTGSIDEAANFIAGPARYHEWCDAIGKVMTCQPSRQGK
jgi:hypothetical protein